MREKSGGMRQKEGDGEWEEEGRKRGEREGAENRRNKEEEVGNVEVKFETRRKCVKTGDGRTLRSIRSKTKEASEQRINNTVLKGDREKRKISPVQEAPRG